MKNRAVIWIILLLMAVGGCAAPARNMPRMFGETKGMELSQTYIQKGRAYENMGSLPEALRQYKLAMVVSHANKAALKDRNRVVRVLRRLATTHYKVGLQFHKAGEYAKARRKFLTALRLNPDYPEALKMLKHQKVIVDVAAMCRDKGIDLFNKKKYPEAIFEFSKAVDENSNDEVAVEYLYKAHLNQGMELFEKEDYLSAKEEFEASLRFNGDCLKCREYIKKSEGIYKEIHYKRGVAYFGKELLFDAVEEWEMVQAIDPNYKNVAYNINKAKTLLKRLDEIRKSIEERQAQ